MVSLPIKRKLSETKSVGESVATKRRHKTSGKSKSQVYKVQAEASILKDAVSNLGDVKSTDKDSIGSLGTAVGPSTEASTSERQLDSSTGKVMAESSQMCNRSNRNMSPFERAYDGLALAVERIKNDTKSKDDNTSNLTESQGNADHGANENSLFPGSANEGLNLKMNGNGCAKRRRRKRERKRARQRHKEQILQRNELAGRSAHPLDRETLCTESQKDPKLIHRPDTDTEPRQALRDISPEIPETPREAHFQHSSVLERTEQGSKSNPSNSPRRRKKKRSQIVSSQQKGQEALAEESTNDARNLNEIVAPQREATTGELQLAGPNAVNLQQQSEASYPDLQQSCCKEVEWHQDIDQLENESRIPSFAKDELEKAKWDLEASLLTIERTNSNLSDKLRVLGEESQGLCSTEAQLEQKIGKLRKLLLFSRRENGDLKRKASLLEDNLASCRSQKAEIRDRTSQMRSYLTTELVKCQERHRDQAESIHHLLSTNASLCCNLATAIEKHKAAIDDISRLKPLNETLITKCDNLRDENTKLRAEFRDTNNKLFQATDNAKELSSHNKRLKWDLERVKKQAESIKADLYMQANTACNETAELRRELHDATTKLHNAMANLSGLGNYNTSLQADLQHVRGHVAMVEADLLSVKEKRNQEAPQMTELKQSNAHLLSESEKSGQMIVKLRAILNETTEKHKKEINNNVELHERSTRLQSAQKDAESQTIRLQSELSKRITDRKQIIDDMQQLTGRISILEKRFQDGKTQENELRSELSKRAAEQVESLHDNKRLNESVATLKKEADEAKNQSFELRSQLSTLTANNESVVKDAHQLRDENATLQEQCQDAKSQITKMQVGLSKLTTKHRQAISKVNVLAHNNSLLQADVNALRKKKDDCETRGQWNGGEGFERFFYGSRSSTGPMDS